MTDWYLVYCKARQEDTAARGLAEQRYAVYLPKLKLRRRRAKGMVEVVQPLFPRYLFVAPNGDTQSITPVQYTAGVSKVVRFGTDYLPIAHGIVEALQAQGDPKTGYHRLRTPTLKRGDRVRIQSGAFAGIEGIFEACAGRDRVIILLELLGQQARAEVPVEELQR